MASVKVMKEVEMIVEMCPFCRNPAATYFFQTLNQSKPQVVCSNCNARGSAGDNAEDAVIKWNGATRFVEARLKQAVNDAVVETTQKLNNEIKEAMTNGNTIDAVM